MKSYTKEEDTEGNVVMSHWYRTVQVDKFEIWCSGKAEHEDELK